MLAYASLLDMHTLVRQRLGFWVGWSFATVALGLSAFGVYLGRYLRFNSWDILSNPFTLFYDIVQRFHRLGNRRLDMARDAMGVSMDHELIDVVHAESPKRGVDRFHDVFAREAELVGAVSHFHGDLGAENVLVPWD